MVDSGNHVDERDGRGKSGGAGYGDVSGGGGGGVKRHRDVMPDDTQVISTENFDRRLYKIKKRKTVVRR